MILLLLILLILIYIQFGLFVLIQIVIWTMVFLTSNLLIALNPFSRQYYVIRAISIIVIISILYFYIQFNLKGGILINNIFI
jgi:hypothetical protein